MNAGLVKYLLLVHCAVLLARLPCNAQTFSPTNWINDPYNSNANFTVVGEHTTGPLFYNTGDQRGTLYFHSPLGVRLRLTEPGDKVTLTGQVSLEGSLNPDGDMQFRIGVFQRGENPADTNWLGYFLGTPTGAGGQRQGLYIRNNVNGSVYTSGFNPHAFCPNLTAVTFKTGLTPASYQVKFSVERLSSEAELITWKFAGSSPSVYQFAGSYTNTVVNTFPSYIDNVGGMGGAGLFLSARRDNAIRFQDVKIIYEPSGEGTNIVQAAGK